MKKMNCQTISLMVLISLFIITSSCKKTADPPVIVTDIEGNNYNTIKIGDQIWMTKNLRTEKFRNGDQIETTEPVNSDISQELTPGYQWTYTGNDGSQYNEEIYGKLYTWYSVADTRGLCPAGWHVPSLSDWTTLVNYLTLNDYGFEGSGNDIAKSLASSEGWFISTSPGSIGNNQSSNNSSGFSAIPGGLRSMEGVFYNIGHVSNWWCSTEQTSDLADRVYLQFGGSELYYAEGFKKAGFSVRCIKDNN